jgi:hypothetical protein
LALFSKLFPGTDVDELAERVRATGFDAIELPVRPGHQCPPQEAAECLMPTVERLCERGIGAPIVTAPVVEPTDPLTRAIHEARGPATREYGEAGTGRHSDAPSDR